MRIYDPDTGIREEASGYRRPAGWMWFVLTTVNERDRKIPV